MKKIWLLRKRWIWICTQNGIDIDYIFNISLWSLTWYSELNAVMLVRQSFCTSCVFNVIEIRQGVSGFRHIGYRHTIIGSNAYKLSLPKAGTAEAHNTPYLLCRKWEIKFKPVSSHFTKTFAYRYVLHYLHNTYTHCVSWHTFFKYFMWAIKIDVDTSHIKHNLFGVIFQRKIVNTTRTYP